MREAVARPVPLALFDAGIDWRPDGDNRFTALYHGFRLQVWRSVWVKSRSAYAWQADVTPAGARWSIAGGSRLDQDAAMQMAARLANRHCPDGVFAHA